MSRLNARGSGRAAALALVAASLSPAGCGGGRSDDATVGTSRQGATATSPSTARAPATSPRGASAPGRSTPASPSGGEEPIRVPATLVFRADGGVDPPTVTVPAFVAIEVTLVSRDGRAHLLRLNGGRRTFRLVVGAGKRQTTRLPGLRAGRYRLAALTGGRGVRLVVGGEAGP